jgi:hypothetical protein
MADPEIAQPVVIHPHAAAQPAIGEIAFAQWGELTGRADPFQAGIQPQRQQQPRIRRWTAGFAFPRPDQLIQSRQIELADEAPHHPRPVIRRQQRLEVDHLPAQLLAIDLKVACRTRHTVAPANPLSQNHGSQGFASYFTGSDAGMTGVTIQSI